jgi:glycosyltransferase involved in cell wall biosynthesis
MDDRIRICAITAAYPAPSEPTRAVFLKNFFEALAEEGFAIDVVAPRVRAEDPAREAVGGIAVERFRYPSRGRRLKESGRPSALTLALYAASGLRVLLRAVRRRRPALIYAHWALPAGVIGALAARLHRLPLVVHAHGSDIHRYARPGSWGARAARWALARAAAVFAVSRELAARIEAGLGVPPERIRVVRMGVDERHFGLENGCAPAAGAAGAAPASRLRVLFVGDLEPAKGIRRLAEDIARRRELSPRIALEVVGDGVDRGALEAVAAERPGFLSVRGRLPQAEVAARCRGSDLLVLPSAGEGCPLAVLEALACGLPVLASPVGGIPELVEDGENGWLARPEDFPGRLMEIIREPARLERARGALRARAADFGARRQARAAAALLRELSAGCGALAAGGAAADGR